MTSTVATYMKQGHGINSVEIVDADGELVSDSRSSGFERYYSAEVKASMVSLRANNEYVATLIIRCRI